MHGCAPRFLPRVRSSTVTAIASSSTTARRRGSSILAPLGARALTVDRAACFSKQRRARGASSPAGSNASASAEARLAPLEERLRALAHVLGREARRERLRLVI